MHLVPLPRPPVRGRDLRNAYAARQLEPVLGADAVVDPDGLYLQIFPVPASAHHAPYIVGNDVVGLVFSCHFVELFSAERIALINAVLEGAGAGAAAITTPAITL